MPKNLRCLLLTGAAATALGGGIDCENSTLSLSNCVINANQVNGATALGGGIYALQSTVRNWSEIS